MARNASARSWLAFWDNSEDSRGPPTPGFGLVDTCDGTRVRLGALFCAGEFDVDIRIARYVRRNARTSQTSKQEAACARRFGTRVFVELDGDRSVEPVEAIFIDHEDSRAFL